jgi:translation initiation factor 1 (eIF-1/SUI1)
MELHHLTEKSDELILGPLLNLTSEECKLLAKELARQMGCNARLEQDNIVLSGDLCDRLAAWLLAKGAKRVVR